ncbi:MAG TPA: VOC family protein [Nitrospiria bacterium]|jgi:catechol 2,3-dioxygenase-like lactoylglutathione lyase family enzyme
MAKIISDSWVMTGVRNVKTSVRFYTQLGLKPTINRPYYAEFNVPGGTVLGFHALEKKKSKKDKNKTRMSDGGWGIMLRVKNLKKATADLKRKKIRCSRIESAPGGADFSTLQDPDGNRLVLLQM